MQYVMFRVTQCQYVLTWCGQSPPQILPRKVEGGVMPMCACLHLPARKMSSSQGDACHLASRLCYANTLK